MLPTLRMLEFRQYVFFPFAFKNQLSYVPFQNIRVHLSLCKGFYKSTITFLAIIYNRSLCMYDAYLKQ